MASTKCHVVDHAIDGHMPCAISYRFLLSDGPHRVSVTYDLLNALRCIIYRRFCTGIGRRFLSFPVPIALAKRLWHRLC